ALTLTCPAGRLEGATAGRHPRGAPVCRDDASATTGAHQEVDVETGRGGADHGQVTDAVADHLADYRHRVAGVDEAPDGDRHSVTDAGSRLRLGFDDGPPPLPVVARAFVSHRSRPPSPNRALDSITIGQLDLR